MLNRRIVALLVGALALLAACVPSGPPGPNPPTGDGDGFIRENASLDRLRNGDYDFLVEYADPGDLRQTLLRQRLAPMVAGAATQVEFHTGIAFELSGLPWLGEFQSGAAEGKITVNIVTASEMAAIGCPGANVVGCGGVWATQDDRVLSGHIAILDEHIVEASDFVLSTTVMHEVGHALNLGHYNAVYNNELQTMHWSGGSHSGDYRSGDKNGLKYMAAGSLEPDATGSSEIVIVDDVLP